MAKNAVTDWDPTAGNNTDIGGVSIAEGCAPSGINDAIRAVMAQIAAWIVAAAGPLLKSGGAMTGAITGMGYGSTVLDGTLTPRAVGYRGIPMVAKTGIALTDVGQCVVTSAGFSVPANATTAFAIGDTIAIYNNSAGAITITAAGGVTLRLAGTATVGSRTLALRGFGTLIKIGTDEWVMTGMGVS